MLCLLASRNSVLCSILHTHVFIYEHTHSLTPLHIQIHVYNYFMAIRIFFLSLLILLQIFSPSRKPNVSSDYVFVISSLNHTGDQWFFPKKKKILILISDFQFLIFHFRCFFSPFWFRHFADMKKKRTKMMMWSDVNDGDIWKPFSLQL